MINYEKKDEVVPNRTTLLCVKQIFRRFFMKKKLLSLAICAAMALSLVACGSTKSSDSDSYTIKEGKLMVGMEIGYPPMEYYDADGTTPIGFDVEVSKAVADYLGLEIEYVDTAWDGIFAGVNTDKYDVIFSSVSIL
jgi:polar amino acid transport system substrate-binding protein